MGHYISPFFKGGLRGIKVSTDFLHGGIKVPEDFII